MDRRQIITAAVAAGLAVGASRASASSSETSAPAEAPTADIKGVALPVIIDGRVRNYVFVALRLHLAPGKPVADVRAKEAFYRDAVVRTAHRASLAVPRDWNRLDEAKIAGAVVAIARVVSGPGVVLRCEIVNQSPRFQVSTPVA